MKDKKSKKAEELSSEAVSANECTGALQNVCPTKEELKKFHKEFIKGSR